MRCVRFCARGVLVLSLVLALGAPAYAASPRRSENPVPKNPLVRIVLKLVQISMGDGLINPWP